ncbi:unnamed protein product, partial [Brenthis ino]
MFVFFILLSSIIVQCLGNTTSSVPIECGLNETFVKCRTICPPQACNLPYTDYLCDPNPNPKCEPGCDCIKDYFRDDEGNCVYNEDCPYPTPPAICGEFEEPITSDSGKGEINPDENCKCIDNYIRDSNGTCVPVDQEPISDGDCKPIIVRAKASARSSSSSSSSSSHASASSSAKSNSVKAPCNSNGRTPCIYDQCTPTCSIPNPSNCPQTSNPCNCASGYILSEEGGQCVKLEECKKYLNCNGDRNATLQECPTESSCKSSCKNPNGFCNDQCDSSGCQCNPLYLLSDEGKCILPNDCPGGNPCSQNETFIYCNAGCPTNYCPKDDSRAIVACSPPYPCPSGCACKANYKRLNSEDNRCILASDCPPVNCTRENEEWNACPPPCFTESCGDINKPPGECYQSSSYCQPQCVCKEGYRRNDNDICVPISNC